MYKKTALLTLCTVFTFTLCSCTTLTSGPIKEGIKLLKWPEKSKKPCERFAFNKKVRVPEWICYPPPAKTDTGAYGLGVEKAGGNLGLKLHRAQADGRAEIVLGIQNQIASGLQKEEMRQRILELSDNNPKVSREEIVAAIDIVVRNILHGNAWMVVLIQTLIESGLQEKEVKQRILELNDLNFEILQEEIDDIVSNIEQGDLLAFGSRILEVFETPDGTIYVLMGITDALAIRKSAEQIIQIALNAKPGPRCRPVEKCTSISKLLSTAIDGNSTIDSRPW